MFNVDYIRRAIAAEETRCKTCLPILQDAHKHKLQALRRALALATAEQDADTIAAEIAAAAHI